jgi:hypothetical protein
MEVEALIRAAKREGLLAGIEASAVYLDGEGLMLFAARVRALKNDPAIVPGEEP